MDGASHDEVRAFLSPPLCICSAHISGRPLLAAQSELSGFALTAAEVDDRVALLRTALRGLSVRKTHLRLISATGAVTLSHRADVTVLRQGSFRRRYDALFQCP
jgi:hypothetical protein